MNSAESVKAIIKRHRRFNITPRGMSWEITSDTGGYVSLVRADLGGRTEGHRVKISVTPGLEIFAKGCVYPTVEEGVTFCYCQTRGVMKAGDALRVMGGEHMVAVTVCEMLSILAMQIGCGVDYLDSTIGRRNHFFVWNARGVFRLVIIEASRELGWCLDATYSDAELMSTSDRIYYKARP